MQRASNHGSALRLAALAALALSLAQCGSVEPDRSAPRARRAAPQGGAAAAFAPIYEVLQHPRCLNCHPAGEAPLQGDDSHVHAQLVQRGLDGRGRYALRCDACHQDHNLPGEHLPPGAPGWHLPPRAMPLVFEGKSAGDLCRQLADPARNGGRTPEQVLEHMARDPLVLWGWSPGEGRTPVSIPHEELVRALRAWIDGGCNCPK